MKILMKRLVLIWSVIVLSCCGLLALADERMTSPQIENIRLGIDGKGKTRVVFDLTEAPTYLIRPVRDDNAKLEVYIENASLALALDKMPSSRGLVRGVQNDSRTIDISLEKEALPVTSFVLPPTKGNAYHRLVIDLATVSDRDFDNAVKAAPQLPTALPDDAEVQAMADADTYTAAPEPKQVEKVLGEPASDLKTVSLESEAPVPTLNPARIMAKGALASPIRKLTIVIDPGHGGKDPGSIGATGLLEKTVTLKAAELLRDELRARGYNVLLTRDEDSFIRLEERIEFARERQADLFMSLHADSNPEPLARGATVYTLSDERSNEMAQNAASMGNFRVFDVDTGRDDEVGRDVGSILFDLASTDTKNESVKLAKSLITEMRGRVPMVRNTHRRMSLQVLLSPDVPAVLVELAFLSNTQDEANLGSAAWRKRATTAVADGIDSYFTQSEAQRTAAGYISSGAINP